MDVDLRPPAQAGPVRIGMSFEEAKASLSALEGFDAARSFTDSAPAFAAFSSGLAFSLSHQESTGVGTVEVYSASAVRGVVYEGIDVFTTPAAELIGQLVVSYQVVIEEDGRLVTLPKQSISFWRATLPEEELDEDGRYFQTVMVAHEGYFDYRS
jgi:hypothetical protein